MRRPPRERSWRKARVRSTQQQANERWLMGGSIRPAEECSQALRAVRKKAARLERRQLPPVARGGEWLPGGTSAQVTRRTRAHQQRRRRASMPGAGAGRFNLARTRRQPVARTRWAATVWGEWAARAGTWASRLCARAGVACSPWTVERGVRVWTRGRVSPQQCWLPWRFQQARRLGEGRDRGLLGTKCASIMVHEHRVRHASGVGRWAVEEGSAQATGANARGGGC
jgi:hypothetical protein